MRRGERAVGCVESVTVVLHPFYLLDDFRTLLLIISKREPHFLRLVLYVALTGQVGNKHTPLVADQLRFEVLVSLRLLQDGIDVHAAFMGESALAHEGPGIKRGDICYVADEQRKIRELAN